MSCTIAATASPVGMQPTAMTAPPPQGVYTSVPTGAVAGATNGAGGGAVSTLGGGGTAVAGAAAAVGPDQLVPVLQQLVAALNQLVAVLKPMAAASGGGAGSMGAPMAAPTAPAAAAAHAHSHADEHVDGGGGTQPAGAAPGADVAKWVTGDTDGLNPDLLQRLATVGERLGKKLTIASGHRTREEQQELYDAYKAGRGNLAARPGTSNHESGNAADVNIGGTSLANVPKAKDIAAELGLHFPVGGEPWHVEVK